MFARALLPLTAAIALAAPTVADAATRYASPNGASDCSSPAAACSLTAAFAAATNGDDIVLAAGAYTPPGSLTDAGRTLQIHPAAGAGRPTVTFVPSGDLSLSGGSTVRDLDLIKPSAVSRLLAVSGGSRLVRVRARLTSTASFGPVVELYKGDLVNTEISVSGANLIAVQTASNNSFSFTTRIVGSTIVATGTGAIAASFSPVGPTPTNVQTHEVVNTILRGTATDLKLSAPGQSEDAHIWNSAYTTVVKTGANATLVDHGGHVTAAPLFVSSTDLRQAPGSPTIDAGLAGDPLASATDLDGDARPLGAAVDIGADELVPPVVDDPPVVDPPVIEPPTGDPGPTPDPITTPAPNGTSTTPTTPAPQPAAKPAAPRATLVTKQATLRKGVLAVRVACPKGTVACTGTLTLKRGKATLATAKVKVAAGRTATLRLRPSRRTAKQIRGYGHAGRPATATLTTAGGTVKATVKVRGR